MADKIKVGVVGTSWWADAMHLPALQNHPEAEIAAICGRNPENASQMGERWSIPRVYTDWETMLNDGDLDALVISTANDTHYPISMKAMRAGMHVLCEKPLAITYNQALEMAQFAAAHNIKTLVPFTYSYMPTARYIKELIDDGYIGKPYHLNLRYYTGYARQGDYMWRFDMAKAGGGIVGDLGSHFLFIAEMMFGHIKTVSCVLSFQAPRVKTDPDGKPYEIADDAALITVMFENGALGSIHVTALCYEPTPFGQTHHMEFHGTDGTLTTFTDWDKIQRISGAKQGDAAQHELHIPDHIWGNARRDSVHNTYKDIFRQQDLMTRQFITGIVEDQPMKPDFGDGARIQRLIAAAQKSHAERRWVEVEEIK